MRRSGPLVRSSTFNDVLPPHTRSFLLESHLKRMDQPIATTVRPCEVNNRILYESALLQMRGLCIAFKGAGKPYVTKTYHFKPGIKYACQGCWNELQKV